ncbi:MAG: hypothetical protein Q7S61_03060 [bacterium]|nr:hypothetical protein [bacterium]
MKLLVTHQSPDFDACAACWLIQKYLPGWSEAELAFVPPGGTYNDRDPDKNPDIIHVDTGKGQFDHHQFSGRHSAAEKVLIYLKENVLTPQKDTPALERIVEFITSIDNFDEVHFANPGADLYDYLLPQLIGGIKKELHEDVHVVHTSHLLFDATLQIIKNKIKNEQEIHKGLILHTSLGKTLVIETGNEGISKFSLKNGFTLVVRINTKIGNINIKSFPRPEYDLTSLYEILKKTDPQANWYFHSSKHIISTGPLSASSAKPTTLTIAKIIEIVKKI